MRARLARLADLARLGLGRYLLRKAEVNLVDVIAAAVGRLDPEAVGRVRVETTGEEPVGYWDPAALGQGGSNLLSNALKDSEPPTSVDVVVAGDARTVLLSVQDRGIGLLPEELAGLFRRYGRARGALEREIGGLGLGLYIVRGLVDAHGGRVWAESDGPGKGTT